MKNLTEIVEESTESEDDILLHPDQENLIFFGLEQNNNQVDISDEDSHFLGAAALTEQTVTALEATEEMVSSNVDFHSRDVRLSTSEGGPNPTAGRGTKFQK